MSFGRFDRMVGIPEDEYQQLKSLQQLNNPLQNKFLTLSNDYRKQGNISDPYVRAQRQGETLNQMINIKEDLRKLLIEATPKPYQSRAQSLFQFVANKLDLNEKGELLDADGSILTGSNIGDLIQHSVRDRRRNIVPVGWQSFLDILRDNNVPRMILNYDTLDEMNLANSKKVPIIKKETNTFLGKKFSSPKFSLPTSSSSKGGIKKSPKSSLKRARKSSRTKYPVKYLWDEEYSGKAPPPQRRKYF